MQLYSTHIIASPWKGPPYLTKLELYSEEPTAQNVFSFVDLNGVLLQLEYMDCFD